MAGFDHLRKHSYLVNITYGDGEGGYNYTEAEVFFGPAMDLESNEFPPVSFTRPYFDCGRSNIWIVDAVSPVVDHLPRYLDWYHLRRHKCGLFYAGRSSGALFLRNNLSTSLTINLFFVITFSGLWLCLLRASSSKTSTTISVPSGSGTSRQTIWLELQNVKIQLRWAVIASSLVAVAVEN